MEAAALDEMNNCLCFGVRRTARALTKFYAREVRGGGLRATQTPILTALAHKPKWETAELADALGLERTTLLRALSPLRREGLVSMSAGRARSPATLAITAKGIRARDAVVPSWRAAQRRAVAVLGSERWSAIMEDLRRVREALDAA